MGFDSAARRACARYDSADPRHDRNTNWRMLGSMRRQGTLGVQIGSNRSGALMALALAAAASVGGCADVDLGPNGGWFRKPLDVFGRSGGYTYSDLGESKKQGSITANQLVDGNGSCPPAPASQPAPAAAGPGVVPAAPPEAESLLGGGVGLGMSECDVVYRAGQPNSVQLGKNPNGDRTAVLTYNSGPRPGIYHFERGALMEMDRVVEPAPPAQAAKKKPAKSKQASRD